MDSHKKYNFGALPMPSGYFVAWFECHEHYQAIGPGENGDYWESNISVDPFQCRRWAIWHAKHLAAIAAMRANRSKGENEP